MSLILGQNTFLARIFDSDLVLGGDPLQSPGGGHHAHPDLYVLVALEAAARPRIVRHLRHQRQVGELDLEPHLHWEGEEGQRQLVGNWLRPMVSLL